jgi:phage tail sheath protein FI
MVVDFLTTQWSAGALEGTSADQGFTVSVDSSLNTPQVIALGQLIIAVTLYTVPPAEYVVFKIVQQPGGSTVTE